MSRVIAVVFILGVFAFAGYSNRSFIKHFHDASTARETSDKVAVEQKAKPSDPRNHRKNAAEYSRD